MRFALVKGGWWERLIDRPHRFGKMKARFAPGESYAGVWWGAAVRDQLRTAREVWIVEGSRCAVVRPWQYVGGWSMADIEAARRFLAGEFENAGLAHIAGAILAGTSSFAQGAYIAAVAAALAAPCAACGLSQEAA